MDTRQNKNLSEERGDLEISIPKQIQDGVTQNTFPEEARACIQNECPDLFLMDTRTEGRDHAKPPGGLDDPEMKLKGDVCKSFSLCLTFCGCVRAYSICSAVARGFQRNTLGQLEIKRS